MRLSFRNLRSKASLSVLLLLSATTLALYLITSRIMNQTVQNEIIKRAEALSRSIASAAGYSLLSQDKLGLDSIVFKTKDSNRDIEVAAILDVQGEVIVHSDIQKAGGKLAPAEGRLLKEGPDGIRVKDISGLGADAYEVTSPIVFMGKPLGSVVLSINKSVLAEAQVRAQKRMIPVVAVVLALGVISSVLLSSLLTRPIKELSSGVEELKIGKRSKPLRVYAQDELGRLTERFNEMTELITVQRESLGRYAQDLEKSYIATVKVLAAAIDARDSYTLGHSTRVAQLSMQLAGEIGLDKEKLEELEIACLFHDVGKIRIPDAILHKRGTLDLPERQEMMRHTEYGTEILDKAPSLHKFIPAVRHHHEWHDGSGYPDGLSGDKIPLPASIISLADAFDAMTSDRPYRRAKTKDEALRQIRELSGRQFNPALVRSFLKMMEEPPGSLPPVGAEG